jgi:glycosyltransferase involved in cell wall biosynthesis
MNQNNLHNPLISCIVPFFNTRKYLKDCLQSIERIDYPNIELILVNDGSTDGSLELAENFLNKSSRYKDSIIICNKKNLGVSASKNIGMKNISGDFFFIAGADDIQNLNRVKIPLEFLQKNQEIDIVYFDCNIISEEGNFIAHRKFPQKMNNQNSILYQIKRNHFWSGLFLARNTIIESFDENLFNAVDYDWFFQIYLNRKQIAFIRDPLINYRIHETNYSRNLTVSKKGTKYIFNKHNFDGLKVELLKKHNQDEVNLSFAWFEMSLGHYQKSIELLQSIKNQGDLFEISFLLGSNYFKLGNFKQSLHYFEISGSIESSLPETLNNIAILKFLTGKINSPDCTDLIREALVHNPRYSDARKNLIYFNEANLASLIVTERPLRDTLIHN